MAHGKETPRQKMIGMMYLVLTALLALNVSKDVLNAFALVDEGLTKTTYNFSSKNDRLYNDFEKAAIQNEKKAGRWKKIADDVKARSNELYNYLQTLKEDIVIKAEGKDNEAIKDGEVDLELVNDKQNMDIPSEVMIGPNQNGKANDLRAFIEEYRVFLLDLVSPKDLSLRESLERNLSTDDRKEADGQVVTWQVANFQSMPLAAAITLMSKMQADVRNSEAEILSYLFGKIDEGAFKFNKLEATIIPNSNYVIRGNEYEASVFIAARDTTQPPVIFVGQYDSVMLEDGTYDYNMKGQEGKDYTQLPIVNGKGIYEVPTSSTGFKTWGGIIQLQAPDGAFIKRPFQAQFQVAEGSFSVSPTKMNVFYRGVDNPVSVSVSGVPADKIRPDISNGNIIKRGNSWIVRPGKGKESTVSVYADIDGTRKRLGTALFRVKNVPDPVAQVNRQKGGKIAKNVLAVQGGVVAEMEEFDFDLTFKVQEFNVVVLDKGGFVRERRSKSNVFTQDQRDLFGSLRRGQKVYIEDIKAVGPDGSVRDLSPIAFVID